MPEADFQQIFNFALDSDEEQIITMIPAGVRLVDITMIPNSPNAPIPIGIDLELFAGGEPIVQWQNGRVRGAEGGQTVFGTSTVQWNGYQATREQIDINDKTPESLQLVVDGYKDTAGAGSVGVTWDHDGLNDTPNDQPNTSFPDSRDLNAAANPVDVAVTISEADWEHAVKFVKDDPQWWVDETGQALNAAATLAGFTPASVTSTALGLAATAFSFADQRELGGDTDLGLHLRPLETGLAPSEPTNADLELTTNEPFLISGILLPGRTADRADKIVIERLETVNPAPDAFKVPAQDVAVSVVTEIDLDSPDVQKDFQPDVLALDATFSFSRAGLYDFTLKSANGETVTERVEINEPETSSPQADFNSSNTADDFVL